MLLLRSLVVSNLLLICLSACTWMYTPGDTVDNSTQSLLVDGWHPEQPIPFSHQKHVVQNQIDCEYCHSAARRSNSAGVPSLNTCMGCHKVVKTDSPHIQKIADHFARNEPIAWVKVNDLPDFVHFSHKVHVNATNPDGTPQLKCQTCHGEIQGNLVADQWAPLQMVWCINCHNQVKVPAQNGHPAITNAPVSCNTCHF